MKLHKNINSFRDTIRAASQHLGIKDEFVEKDYWITLVLSQLSKAKYAEQTVFKGGTSLSKGYSLINRFSEDVDIAIIDEKNKSGNEIKTIIRTIEKEMTKGLDERFVEGVSSKGSRFRKSVFEYPPIDSKNYSNTLIVEINSFANPYPFQKLKIKSFIFDFFMQTGNGKYIEANDLHAFEINILSKEQTLLEKLVSLIRFSFDTNAVLSIASKIRHFYDLYFLLSDPECFEFVRSESFKTRFHDIILHDKELFDIPEGWKEKGISDSPLIVDFENLWLQLKETYKSELSALAYTEIPNEKDVARQFIFLSKMIH